MEKRRDIQGKQVQPVVITNESGSYRPSFYSSAALESNTVIKTTSGVLYNINGYNDLGSAQFIHISDRTASADNFAPDIVLTVAANSNFTFDGGLRGIPFDTGLVVANSSTVATGSIGAADCWFSITYL